MSTDPPAAGRSARAWALALTSIAFFMGALDTTVVITALPAVHRDLGGSLDALQWTVNAYALASAAGIVTAAALGDRFGRRRVFAVGLALFATASAACALSPTTGALIAARAVQGVGAAMVMPLALTILSAAFPPERRGTVVGIWGGIGGLAIAGGPLVGGAVTQGLDWHWIFWLNVPIGLVASAAAALRLRESHGPAARLDAPAVGLVAAGSVSVVWALVHAGGAGWADPWTAGALVLGLALLGGFVLWERRAAEPILPPRLFARRRFAAANATTFLMSGALLAAAFLMTQYFQFALGEGPLSAGLHFLPMTGTPLLVAPIAGMLSDRIGHRPVMALGMLLTAAGLAWFAREATAGAGLGQLVVPMIVAGAGVSMPFATAANAALTAAEPGDIGRASGVNTTMNRFGGAFGVAVATAVFAANGHLGAPAGVVAGLRPALAVTVVLALLGAATALAAGERLVPQSAQRRNYSWEIRSSTSRSVPRTAPASETSTGSSSDGRLAPRTAAR